MFLRTEDSVVSSLLLGALDARKEVSTGFSLPFVTINREPSSKDRTELVTIDKWKSVKREHKAMSGKSNP